MSATYSFVDDWYIDGDIEEVADILTDAPAYARWWSSVYREVSVEEPGDGDGIGKVLDIRATGWLPYGLRFRAEITEANLPGGFSMDVTGDFVGTGTWTLEERGSIVHARFTWRVEVTKPIVRYFSGLFRPIFAANHRWAMRRGEEAIHRELERRRSMA